MKKEKPGVTDGDDDFFTRAMADVIRLPSDRPERVRPAPPAAAPRAARAQASPVSREESEDDPAAGFVAPGVDRRELRKLKRGGHPASARIDLHGLSAAAATAGVQRFVDASRHHHRCVCIVHGRGLHSPGSIAILKARVRECLRHHRAVLAYADAPRTDGGDGAVYVLLRK